jgi:hypothetical protein
MICVNFEKDVFWQVLTVQVDELVDKVSSLRNNGKELYFKSKELGIPYGTVILTKEELYTQVFERFKDDERYKEKDNFEGIFHDSYNGIDKANNIFNVIYNILSRAILVKTKLDVLDNEYRQKMLDLTTSKLSTERLAEKVKNLTVMYDNKQKTSEKFKEIYNKLVFCGNGIAGGQGHLSNKYKDIYIWLKDMILISYQLNNLADVDNGIYAQFKIANIEDWIPRTFAGSHPIQFSENIRASLVLSINNVLFVPCKDYLEDMEGRFLEPARKDEHYELFHDLFSGKIKKNWFSEDFGFQDLEDATSFYRAVYDKLI